MKILGILAILFVAGCAARPTMQELETQAMFSGDWSAVESRERAQLRRKARNGIQCPNGKVGYCVESSFTRRCTCINRDTFRFMMTGR